LPKVIGGLLALIALAASTLAQVDPWTTLFRGFVAYAVGGFLTQLWYVFFTVRVQGSPNASGEAELGSAKAEPIEERAAA